MGVVLIPAWSKPVRNRPRLAIKAECVSDSIFERISLMLKFGSSASPCCTAALAASKSSSHH